MLKYKLRTCELQSFRSARFLSAAATVLIAFSGCDSKKDQGLDDIWAKTLKATDQAFDQVGSMDSASAKREFAKLAQYEYQVIPFKSDIAAGEIQKQLSLLGARGWDCAPPLMRQEELLLFCKKRPDTVFRYVPQTILGR